MKNLDSRAGTAAPGLVALRLRIRDCSAPDVIMNLYFTSIILYFILLECDSY